MSASLPARTEATTPAPDPALTWRTTADWIEAQDGTIVAVRPGYMLKGAPGHFGMPASEAAWPARRGILAASAQMLAALEGLFAVMPFNVGEGDEPEGVFRAAWAEARAAIAAARATW